MGPVTSFDEVLENELLLLLSVLVGTVLCSSYMVASSILVEAQQSPFLVLWQSSVMVVLVFTSVAMMVIVGALVSVRLFVCATFCTAAVVFSFGCCLLGAGCCLLGAECYFSLSFFLSKPMSLEFCFCCTFHAA